MVDPDYLISSYGADTVRLFCLSAAPPEKDLDWSDQGVEGAHRFLNRVWGVVHKNCESLNVKREMTNNNLLTPRALQVLRKTHQTIKRVTNDIERDYHFNTAIAALMELMNEITTFTHLNADDMSVLSFAIKQEILLLAPFAPHIAEELYHALGGSNSLFDENWPACDEGLTKEEDIELVIQINGKLRSKVMIPAGLDDESVKEKALQDAKIAEYVKNKPLKKIIIVNGRLVNIVI